MNYYFAYGVSIATDIIFPEMFVIPPTDTPDVSVWLGTVPAHIKEKINPEEPDILITPEEYYLCVKDEVAYYASNGNEVIIEPLVDADDKSIRLFFLSNAMAAILYQRGRIPMHCSAIYADEGIVLFMGNSGVGKSTTVARLQAKGYRIFSDDICVPAWEDGILRAYAAYPMMKLWKDAYEKVGIESFQEENRIRPEMEKYHKSFYQSFDIQALPIKQIFILEKDPDLEKDVVRTLSIQGIEAFKHIQYYAYRLPFADAMGKKKAYFETISALSNQIPVTLISRPDDNTIFNDLTPLIEGYLGKISIED